MNSVPSVVLRMQEELAELRGRLERANAFVDANTTFATLPVSERDLFHAQIQAMTEYEVALSTRLDLISKRLNI